MIRTLFIVNPIVCSGFDWVLFCNAVLSVLSSRFRRGSWLFYIVLFLSCGCWYPVSLPHGAVGLVCGQSLWHFHGHCGISFDRKKSMHFFSLEVVCFFLVVMFIFSVCFCSLVLVFISVMLKDI